MDNRGTMFSASNSLLWYHNNTLLFFCKERLQLWNTRFETVTVKSSRHGEKRAAWANALADRTHTSHDALSPGLRVLFEEYMNPAFVSQRRLLLKKKSSVQTQSRLAGTICSKDLCCRDGFTLLFIYQMSNETVTFSAAGPTTYICATKTAIPWLWSATKAWLKCSLLTFVRLSHHLSLLPAYVWEYTPCTQVSPWSPVGQEFLLVHTKGCVLWCMSILATFFTQTSLAGVLAARPAPLRFLLEIHF